ncbi:condensation domain-containing protein [Deinococcus soli (ex Cha et al. 2016)]|uniref:Nonribosomal peptide synthetase MxcG n=2 Tax=Deinococcus soli (ex Cha et al. 2016) TaxID=1309411 RepID=A0ACC6KF33_9DEIO|nr:condensation domain-containing protein [Deinococcus soli (ex Cha et al. 2016)]MDR6217973.1 nonribosomal peptide synthetase MxcG [Deinococcus soli (ex Cha et al. 2016)]MDR6751075.1 nonribosomal peptide synthetase MxcG [Deinococcus soli (ex Cha et al. 2016)]GGB55478.1 hypothetical protein GCM10008019_08970 [Deinococcus soli (ex Cha et al. 2016)]
MTVPLPVTLAQRSLWPDLDDPDGSVLNHVVETLDLRGPLDPARFEAALTRALADVAALHVRYAQVGGQPAQLPTGEPPRPPGRLDWRAHPDPEAPARAHERDATRRPLGLRTGDLYRHALHRLADDHWRWVFVTHHIALDGYGVTQLLTQLAAHHRALGGLHAPPAPFGPLAAPALEDRAYDGSAQQRADGARLRATYADLPFEAAPLLHLGLQIGHRAQRTVPAALVRILRTVTAAWGAAWPDALNAACAAQWHARTGEQAVLIAAPVMLRLGSAAAHVPCMRMNLVPLRIEVHPGDDLATQTRRAQAARTHAQGAAPYRLERLWADLDRRRLFGPEVNVIPFAAPLDFGPGLEVTRDTPASGPVEDLAFTFSGWRDDLTVTADGHPALHTPQSLEALLDDLLRRLDTGLRVPALREVSA